MEREYLSNKIANANEAQLVAVLYEAAMMNLEAAAHAIEKENQELLTDKVEKTRDIIAELNATIQGDSQIAMDTRSLYVYVNKVITQGKTEKSPEKLEEAIKVLKPLYEAWAELGEKQDKEGIEKKEADPNLKKKRQIVAGMTYGKGNLTDHVLNDNDGLGRG